MNEDDESSHEGENNIEDDVILNREDFTNYVTITFDADIPLDFDNDIGNDNLPQDEDQNIYIDRLPSTDAGDLAFETEETTKYRRTQGNIVISGHVLLNQCGTLLTRKKHQIKVNSRHNYFLQRICATSIGEYILLMYPEGILFPSIYWKMAADNYFVVGAIPAPLLTELVKGFGFAPIQEHIRSRLTSTISATSTDSRYCAHCYDILTNLAVNHEDTHLILNRGLTVADDAKGGLGLRGKGGSSLLESIDNKQMVKNLCFSQKYHP